MLFLVVVVVVIPFVLLLSAMRGTADTQFKASSAQNTELGKVPSFKPAVRSEYSLAYFTYFPHICLFSARPLHQLSFSKPSFNIQWRACNESAVYLRLNEVFYLGMTSVISMTLAISIKNQPIRLLLFFRLFLPLLFLLLLLLLLLLLAQPWCNP